MEYYQQLQTYFKGLGYSPEATEYYSQAAYVQVKGNAYDLTHREAEILAFIGEGMSNKEIANRLDVSVRTIETHRLSIRRKTSANTLSDLVRAARRVARQDEQRPAEKAV